MEFNTPKLGSTGRINCVKTASKLRKIPIGDVNDATGYSWGREQV
jgi:hypothetical protein